MISPFRPDEKPASSGGADRLFALAVVGVLMLVGVGWWGWSERSVEPRCVAGGPTHLGETKDALACTEALWAVRYVETLAARSLEPRDRLAVLDAIARRHAGQPAALQESLAAARAFLAGLAALPPMDAAEARSLQVWKFLQGDGAIAGSEADGLQAAGRRAIGVWSVDDTQRLVLTEMDVEGWIRYASLCREVQGGGALRVSVSDRVTVYGEVQARFDEGDRARKISMTAMGPYWTSTRLRWQESSYEEQRRWIDAAPLPPPMTATSLGYVAALLDGSITAHVTTLHDQLGPLDMDVAR
jgi:hypothetical protein